MDKRFVPGWLIITALFSACSASTERKLGEHVFDIPKANDIAERDRPFFLPPSNPRDGFSFILNPAGSLPNQNLIAVASKEQMCARAEGTQARINATICAVPVISWRGIPLRKVSDGGLWTYNLPTEAHGRPMAALVSCFAMADGDGQGLCTAPLPHDDLVITIHLRDDQIASLASLYDQAVTKLQHWER
ncbi:hypothetical protein [Novosphingobium soli]|uniref:DUF3558 domain-containing protein n=1 Tax=Novosphingobium soli TaxID=574956 RepID=A0ABV6D1C1_9SPHN